jgi:predicted Zn-dependent peptidase
MNRIKLSLSLLALFAGFAFAGDRPVDKLPTPPMNPFSLPTPKPVKLANGIQGYILEDRDLPLVDVQVILRAGSVWDPEDEVGLASIAGSVWRKGGTKTHPKEKLDEILEKHGASLEAGIGHDQGSIHLSCLKEDLELGLSLMKELLTEPLLPEDKLAETKEAMISAIERRNDQGPPIASRLFAMQIYGKKSPYARQTTVDSINKISQKDLVAWQARFVRPENAIVGAHGDQSADEFEKKLGTALGSWKCEGEAKRPEMPLVEVAKKPACILIDKPEINQSAIHIGHIGAVRSPEAIDDYAKVLVMNDILGGGGFSSRLMLHVRSDQGLAYSTGSHFGWDYDHPGTCLMMCETKSETTGKAIRSLLHELEVIRTELPTDEEIAVAKDSILNQLTFTIDTTEKLMDNALRYTYRGFPLDTIKRLGEGVKKVTKEDVRKAAQTLWNPDALVIVVCGNSAKFDEPLEKLTKATVEKISDPEAWAEGKAQPAGGSSSEGDKPIVEGPGPASPTLGKMLEAAGGKKTIADLKVLKLRQTTEQGGNEVSEDLIIEFPDKERRDMDQGGQKVTIIFDGKDASAVVPGQGTFKLPPQQVTSLRSEIAGMTANVYRSLARGEAKVTSESDDTFAGKPAKKLVIDVKGARKQTFFIDPTSGALLGKEQESGMGKLRVAVDETKEVAGVKLPTKLTVRKAADAADAEPVATMTVTKCEGNPKVDADTFKVPEGKDLPKGGGGDDEGDDK